MTTKDWVNDHQAKNLKRAIGERLFMAMEMMEPTMPITHVTIERETAINNIAVTLFKKGLLNVPAPSDSRLEPFLTLSPVVLLVSEAIDEATIGDPDADPSGK